MPTYRADLAYDGSGFHGYARQPGLRTVQGDLEAALAPWTAGAETAVAGRTDKGVHATGQVVSFVCDRLDTKRLVRSLNHQLAPEIAVLDVTEVGDGFHARFSATGRAYRYRILNRAVHDPLQANLVWFYEPQLDVDAMDRSVRSVTGEHDFAAFCRKYQRSPTTRRVAWAGWHRDDDLVELAISATSFCHQMVRSIVAVSVEIGRGRLEEGDMEAILHGRTRTTARGAAPSCGLTLTAVSYGAEPLPRPPWVPETW